MVLTAYFVLSPATNSSCHRHPRIEVLSARSGRLSLREFNTSNGCQNHTALPSAQAPFVRVPFVSSGLVNPPCHPLTSPDALASTASRPAFVTTRDPPLLSRRDSANQWSDLPRAERKIFLQKGLESILLICPRQSICRICNWHRVSGSGARRRFTRSGSLPQQSVPAKVLAASEKLLFLDLRDCLSPARFGGGKRNLVAGVQSVQHAVLYLELFGSAAGTR